MMDFSYAEVAAIAAAGWFLALLLGLMALLASLEVEQLRKRRGALLRALSDALWLAKAGDYRNGVTDPTGTIDEGEVRGGQELARLTQLLETERALAAEVAPRRDLALVPTGMPRGPRRPRRQHG